MSITKIMNQSDLLGERLTTVQLLGLSVAIGLLVFYPVVTLDFQLRWDDQWVVMNAYTEDGLNYRNIWSIFSEFYHGQYSPINQIYYTALYSLFGYSPTAFHSGGLFFHLLNTILVFFFINKLMIFTRTNNPSTKTAIAFFTSILFLVHPISVEAVAWISASKVLLYSFFFLLSLINYLNFINHGKRYYLWLTALFYICSFGSKEQGVVLPLCLLLMDIISGRNIKDFQVWKEKIPFILLALFFGYITILSQSAAGSGLLSPKPQYPIYQRLVFASYSLTEYFTKCLIPIKLSYIYPFPNQIGDSIPLRYWLYPIIVIFGAFAVWKNLMPKWVLYSIIFFIINLLVTLHIIPISRFAITADRYVYISSIGIAFLIAYMFYQYVKGPNKYKSTVKIIGAIYLLYLAGYTNQRIEVWYDSELLKKEIKTIIENREDYEELKKSKINTSGGV